VVPSSGSCRSANSRRNSRNRSLETRSCVSRCVAARGEAAAAEADASASAEVAASNRSVLAEEQVVVEDAVVVVVGQVRCVKAPFRRREVDDRVGEIDDRDGTVVHACRGTASEPKTAAMTAKADTKEEERVRTERAIVMAVVVVVGVVVEAGEAESFETIFSFRF
jgi:hypothetical protein